MSEGTTKEKGPTIVLGVAASLEAHRAADLARALREAGARVIPVMGRGADRFLGAATLAGITGEPVQGEGADAEALGREADVLLLVPATGDPGDLLISLARAARGPVLALPERGAAGPGSPGRAEVLNPSLDPAAVAAAALARTGPRDLGGLRVVITAGPTVEDLDPVRFLGNRSSGKMGFAVAARAAARGAATTLIAGPVVLPSPPWVRRVDVRGALEMQRALRDALGPDLDGADALVMSAAVADYRARETSPTKRKRSAEDMSLELVPNPDLLAEIGAARAALPEGKRRPVLVGFAVETDTDARVVAYARDKLVKKRVDLVVANHAGDAFGRDDNRATIVDPDGAEALGVLPKPVLADRILDRVAQLCHR